MRNERTWVALGDSTGVGVGARGGGYVERTAERLTGVRVVNLCRSGATARDVRRVSERLLPPRFDLATVSVGVNDLKNGVDVDDFSRSLDAVVARLATSAEVLVANLPDVSQVPIVPSAMRPILRAAVEHWNERVADVVEARGVRLFDLFGKSRGVLAARRDLFCADGFHPSDAGYELWAGLLHDEISRLSGVPAREGAAGLAVEDVDVVR